MISPRQAWRMKLWQKFERIYIVACGSAYHVGSGWQICDRRSGKDPGVEVDLASEFRYRNPILEENSLVIVVSQSGETADSLAALRLAKERGVPVIGIVNVVGSSIARESDYILYTYAGPEISVATTQSLQHPVDRCISPGYPGGKGQGCY